jgi:methylmalonyl-CoA mutase C-terminal domain/subunit
MTGENIRVLVAKPGLDGHDRGAKVICRSLRDAGFEVIYTGLRRTPDEIVNAAVQEDVDVVGLSILSGAHNVLFPKIMDLLKEKGVDDIAVIAGGIIPDKDLPLLEKIGISKTFLPGSSTKDIVDWIKKNVKKRP